MADDVNRADVIVDLKDVYGQTITDQVQITLYNQKVQSLNQRFTVDLMGKPERLSGVPAFPNGLAQVFVDPKKYRYKSILINVFTGEPNVINEDLFVEPNQAKPKLIAFQDLQAKTYGAELLKILAASGIQQPEWDALNKRIRATILNLSAKMTKETTKDNQPLIRQVNSIDQTWLDIDHRERMFCRVNNDLMAKLRDFPENFRAVSGGLHHFPDGWVPIDEPNSFKTDDPAGNIQLTFATNGEGAFLADIDLDDHKGIKHAADVLKHIISRKETDSYDIHEILKYFQNLDPEYVLI